MEDGDARSGEDAASENSLNAKQQKIGIWQEYNPWQISYQAATWKEQWFCQTRGCRKEQNAKGPCDGETEAIQAQLKPIYG